MKEMTKMQSLIKEINKLDINDLEVILKEVLRRVNRKKRIEKALDNLIGIGQGVWDLDAQAYIQELREDDR